MGRKASISTQQVMAALPSSDYSNHPILQRILQMFQNPTQHTDYLNSQQFAKDLFKLCQKIRHSLEKEPRVVFLQSVCTIDHSRRFLSSEIISSIFSLTQV